MSLILTEDSGGYILMEDSGNDDGIYTVSLNACRTQDREYEYALNQSFQLAEGIQAKIRFVTNPQVDLTGKIATLYISNRPEASDSDMTYTNETQPNIYSEDFLVNLTDEYFKPGNTYYGSMYCDGDLLATIVFDILNTSLGE